MFNIFIGDEISAFDCDENCDFSGATNYFYTSSIEDTIVLDKWITKPDVNNVGVPATFIVTEREEYLTMNDDCNYTTQNLIPWGASNVTCYKKDDPLSTLKIDYDVFPVAGEEIKVCFQTQNYFRDEVDLEFYDFYMDSDVGETVVSFQVLSEGYVPSITDDKLYLSETPSREFELGGNLIDSYGIMCSRWFTLPNNIQGGNNWDIQGKVKINSIIYDLSKEIIWNWESDEFPIFGRLIGEENPEIITINDVRFTKDNVTEGEYIQLQLNITNNHLTKSYNIRPELDLDSNYGGTLRVIETSPYNGAEDDDFSWSLAPNTTNIFLSSRYSVPYGLKDIDEHDVIRANALIHILGGIGETKWIERWDGTDATINVTNYDFRIDNVSVSIYNTATPSCTPYIVTMNYSNILSHTKSRTDEETFVLKGCTEDTTNDIFLHCSVIEAQPDSGEFDSAVFFTNTPYTATPIEAELDIWVYSFDKTNIDPKCTHCGELVYFFSGNEGTGTFNITPTYTDECRYARDLGTILDDTLYLNWLLVNSTDAFKLRQTEALEARVGRLSNGLTNLDYFNSERIGISEITETQLMKFFINITKAPDYGTTYKVTYFFYPRAGTGELVDEIETEIQGIGNHSIYLRSSDLNPTALVENYTVKTIVSMRNINGIWEDFSITAIGNITVNSQGTPAGETSGVGTGVAGKYDIIVDTLRDKYEREETVTFEIFIKNTGDIPDEDTELVYFLVSPEGKTYARTTETLLEVPQIGLDNVTTPIPKDCRYDKEQGVICTRDLTFPTNTMLGEWNVSARYFTTVQPVARADDSVEVVERLSLIERVIASLPENLQKNLNAKKVILFASSLGIFIIFIIFVLILLVVLKKEREKRKK